MKPGQQIIDPTGFQMRPFEVAQVLNRGTAFERVLVLDPEAGKLLPTAYKPTALRAFGPVLTPSAPAYHCLWCAGETERLDEHGIPTCDDCRHLYASSFSTHMQYYNLAKKGLGAQARFLLSNYPGTCRCCKGAVARGEGIYWVRSLGTIHADPARCFELTALQLLRDTLANRVAMRIERAAGRDPYAILEHLHRND